MAAVVGIDAVAVVAVIVAAATEVDYKGYFSGLSEQNRTDKKCNWVQKIFLHFIPVVQSTGSRSGSAETAERISPARSRETQR